MASSLDNLRTVAEEYAALRMQKAEIDARMKDLEPVLREALADRGNVSVGRYVFTVKTVAGRKSLDKAALSEALSRHGLDMGAFEKVGAPYTTMSVKELDTL